MPHILPLATPASPAQPITSPPTPKPPVWAGPASIDPQGGITQSLIGRWLVDRERCRLYVMDGLCGPDKFSHRMEYGNLFHAAEEANLAGQNWQQAVARYAAQLDNRYPMDRREVDKWANVCMVQFPLYLAHWARHPETAGRVSLLQEKEFSVPYKLPSGRVAVLRGKWDSVDVIDGGLWITDHKTKGDLDQQQIVHQLAFDLQTMTYLAAFVKLQEDTAAGNTDNGLPDAAMAQLRGVRYNCIKRPLSGGKGSIVQKKGTKNVPAESFSDYMGRLAEVIRETPHEYFVRFQAEVTPDEVRRFQVETLDPVLENVYDDYEWWSFCHDAGISPFDCGRNHMTRECEFPGHVPRHYRMPYGVVPLEFRTDLDDYLATGSDAGLRRVDDLFPELGGVKDA